jgi:hypothetical protein
MKQVFLKHLGIILVVLLLLLAAVGTGIYYYWRYEQLVTNPQTDAALIAGEANKLVELPKEEQPTVATVTDSTQLASQPFFTAAKNGDEILIYKKAKKIVVYRPSENRVVAIGTLPTK